MQGLEVAAGAWTSLLTEEIRVPFRDLCALSPGVPEPRPKKGNLPASARSV